MPPETCVPRPLPPAESCAAEMATDRSAAVAIPSYAKVVTAYAVLARDVAREFFDLRVAAAWAASFLRSRLEPRPAVRRTVIIKRCDEEGRENRFYVEANAYLAARIDPRAVPRFCLNRRHGPGSGWYGNGDGEENEQEDADREQVLSMVAGDSMMDVFDGVEFMWAFALPHAEQSRGYPSLQLSFDAEHTGMVLNRYIPSITASVEEEQLRERALKSYINESTSWRGITLRHPTTFDTVAMDPALKQSVIDDLSRFLRRKELYRRIGKAWKRGYLLDGPPGTGKSSLVAAIANHLRFSLYDLNLSDVHSTGCLQRLLVGMSDRSILVIEDVDCYFSVASKEENMMLPLHQQKISLSGLLHSIDGLCSMSGEGCVIIFTTNCIQRLDPALLRPGRMDVHISMDYCCVEGF